MDDFDEVNFHADFYKNAKRLHDVPYISRYDSFEETLEMERFIREVASKGLEDCLLGIYYDSKACVCDIETVKGLTASSPDGVRLIQAAAANISQFHLLDAIGHRR